MITANWFNAQKICLEKYVLFVFFPHSFSNIVLSFPNEFKVTIPKYF